jgi:hypothetical protein
MGCPANAGLKFVTGLANANASAEPALAIQDRTALAGLHASAEADAADLLRAADLVGIVHGEKILYAAGVPDWLNAPNSR